MIKGLRKKFILINMVLVTLVLIIVFTMLIVSSSRKYEEDSERNLEHALMQKQGSLMLKRGMPVEPGQSPKRMNLIFIVSLNRDETISDIDESGISVTAAFAQEAVEDALNTTDEQGMLRNLTLRFRKAEINGETKIAFEDCGREIEAMKSLLLASVLTFLGSLMAFFFIALYLSKWALGPVEKAWRQQKQFIADASHELKTPLTVILANLRILSAHPEDTIRKQGHWLDNTQTEAARMKQLLDNLLFLAKSDAASVPQVFEEFDLSNTLLSCILPFESLAYEQHVTLQEEIAGSICMNGDEGQIKQLIAILLDNGCKYAGEGGRVNIHLMRRPDRLDRAMLIVQNTGEAIPKEELEHVFERFYRSDKSRVRTKGGYGLGLSIAKTIVAHHHGKIQAESTKAMGTVFTVTLPVLSE